MDKTSIDNTTGIGLGLSICKEIIDAFGGGIYIDDTYNEGTKICFYLKCDNNQFNQENFQ